MRPILLLLLALLPLHTWAAEDGEDTANHVEESHVEQDSTENNGVEKSSAAKKHVEKNIDALSFVRDVGYRVGDVVSQRVEVITPAGYELDEATLPKRLGAGAHIELRNVAQQSSRVEQGVKHTLTFEWQVFRTLRDVRPIPLRVLELSFRHGDDVLVANVQAAEVLMAPMLPTMLTKEQATPRMTIAPQPQALQPYWGQFAASLLALLIAGLYFAWRFDWLPGWMTGKQQARPFRKAARAIRQQGKQAATATGLAESMRLLSRAFNEYSGKALTAEGLQGFFQRHPEMQSLQSEITQFYAATQQVFFAGNSDAMQQTEVARLARQLSLLETP